MPNTNIDLASIVDQYYALAASFMTPGMLWTAQAIRYKVNLLYSRPSEIHSER
jgi:hypothetical protein